jgi:hypothetical protein
MMCIFCSRPKTQCAGWRSCNNAKYDAAKINKTEWEEKERERELRAKTEPANVIRTKRPTSEDGHLL